MLRNDERLYFIHIPKTAGTTLTPLIDMHFHTDEICPAQLWRDLVHLPQADLPRYRLFRGHFGGDGLNAFLPDPPVFMTMLREPVPLTLSTYKFIWREPGTRVHKLVRDQNMSLADFLDNRRTLNKVSDKQVRHLSFDLEHDPDSGPIFHNRESRAAVDQWVKGHRRRVSPQERLQRAKDRLTHCRFFGLVERFEESMALMSYSFAWPPIGRVQKLMVAPKPRDQGELTDELEEKIRAANQLDLELYGFAEDLFNKRLTAMRADLSRFGLPARVTPSNGTANGTSSFDFDRTYRQLDQHYLGSRSPEPGEQQEGIRVSFDEPLFGDGWHRRESSSLDGTTFRWTGPGTVSTLDLSLRTDHDLRLTLCIINTLDQSIVDAMQVSVNDVPIDMEHIASPAKGRVYQGRVSAEILQAGSGVTRLAITTPHTIEPKAIETLSDDTREVGVAVNWIAIAPTSVSSRGQVPREEIDDAERGRRRVRRRQAVLSRVKQRVAQLPIVGPRLRDAYIKMKTR